MNYEDEGQFIDREKRKASTKGSKAIKAFLQDLISKENFLSDIQTIRARWDVQKPIQKIGERSLPSL